MKVPSGIRRILVGGSAGSINQLPALLGALSTETTPPIVLLVHLGELGRPEGMREVLRNMLDFECCNAEQDMPLQQGHIHVAQGRYHLLIDPEGNTCRLFDDEPYCFAKPSIDLLFESCVGPEAEHTLAVLLSGANDDGARGMADLHAAGGLCAVADPEQCLFPTMPKAALQLQPALYVLNPLELRN